ncbi:CobW family GTP-binding protein [Streptomyces sp. CMB-StM0423]|uniref:CobW family GTP-binding protein n=1 Tax=Streptomyces sp. CMB-StM0423 TaxID=2059884 RepID=UPI000C7063A3|nr:GTP-binding protein [Streptomyces sp. CMB-StM0423]AUH41906.1 cobalamin biosynthesis protein CobW [Streptomyces sp. CMB-StM0423]
MGSGRIPVVVLAGFLGSGKTTLLNGLLRNGGGTRIGAVVNDFGSIEIDAMAVAGQVDSMVSLGNGCLCCAVDTTELDAYLDRLAGTGRIDVIVVEASGLAEPQELVRMVLASENDRIVYGGLVEVVDGAEFAATRERHPEIDRHLAVADLVVLNKTDRIDDAERRRLHEAIGEPAPGTPVVATAYGRVDPELFFDPRGDDAPGAAAPRHRQLSFADLAAGESTGDDHDAHLHAAYESVEFATDQPISPRRLLDFLDTRPAGLYRVKGFVHFGVPGHPQKYGLHAVGRFLRFRPAPWGRGEERGTRLVLIGAGIDAGAVRKELDACCGHMPEDGGEDAMWGVLRYVDGDEDPAA